MRRKSFLGLLLATAFMLTGVTLGNSPEPQIDGISRLILVAQEKARNANDEAIAGAERQRELLKRQKDLRNRAREQAFLRELEENSKRTSAVLISVNQLAEELKRRPCK
ncbi:MAG TPA: hypothetical protein VIT88_01425 [Pyrinomonadaceae bacterium]